MYSTESRQLNRAARSSPRGAYFFSPCIARANPCFEVWFLFHFRYSTHAYYTSAEAVKDLKNYIPNYEKNLDVAPLIADDLGTAMKNAERIKKHYENLGAEWPSNACNPRTDVPVIIDAMKEYKTGKQRSDANK